MRLNGIPQFPREMITASLYGSKFLRKRANGICYQITVYQNSRPVTAVAKIFNTVPDVEKEVVREATLYRTLEAVDGVPYLLGASVCPPAIVTTLSGPQTLEEVILSPTLPRKHLATIVKIIVEKLQELHARKLTPIDFKSKTILISMHEDRVKSVLIDFGPHCMYGGNRMSKTYLRNLLNDVLTMFPQTKAVKSLRGVTKAYMNCTPQGHASLSELLERWIVSESLMDFFEEP